MTLSSINNNWRDSYLLKFRPSLLYRSERSRLSSMSHDDYLSASQVPSLPGNSTDWTSISPLPMSALQSNALAESAGWPQFLGPAAALSREDQDTMAGVGDFNYAQHLNGSNLLLFIPAENPGVTGQVVDCNQEFATYMPSIHPNVKEKLNNTPVTNRASSLLRIDADGFSPSFGEGDPTTQSIASGPSSNNGWTEEQDKLLMSLKAQGLVYSAIQDEMRKAFGWTRNKNVLVKRFAVLKKRCKPQIKTRVSRNHLPISTAISH